MIDHVSRFPAAPGIRRKPAVRELLARHGVLDRISEENVHRNIDHTVKRR
jgi:hypothetical protein